MNTDPRPIVEAVVSQHAEETAILWVLRDLAVRAPHYTLGDLDDLEQRIGAHLHGVRLAGDAGWSMLQDALRHQEPGEFFAAGTLALEGGLDNDRLAVVLNMAETAPEAVRGLVSALGWVERKRLAGTVRDMLTHGSPFMRMLGIAACAVHRADPGQALVDGVGDPDPVLRARALRTAGMLKRLDLLPAVARAYGDDDEPCRFWAAWSGAMMKEPNAIAKLRAFARPGSPYAGRAFEVALRAMDPTAAVEWLKAIGKHKDLRRLLIIGSGVVGNPVSVHWLIRQMTDPEHARVAAEAVAMITGVDIAEEDLEGEWPEGFSAGPSEDPEDEDVEMDPDEDLPWPEPAAVDAWWDSNKARFKSGQRYLLGVPIAPGPLKQVLRTGTQRQRYSAAMELALTAPDAPLFETRAPGKRQQALMVGK